MKETKVIGYKKKDSQQLLKAIENCSSLSQLFALIQHENISLQMHSQSGASNIKTKRLSPKEIIEKKDSPLERLKGEVLKAVEQDNYNR